MKTAVHNLQKFPRVADRPAPLSTPHAVAELFWGLFDDRREAFLAVYLDARHRPLAPPYVVSVGSLSASLVHPREVFRPAIELGAAALIVGHNHPSGNPAASRDDIELTTRLDKAGDILGIRLLDHVIFGDPEAEAESDRFSSLRADGWPCDR